MRRAGIGHAKRTLVTAVLALACTWIAAAHAASTGKIQGKIVGTDTGEPIGFADVLLIPADTTLHKVGGLTTADGTFLLEAAPGQYTLQIRMLSYGTKRVTGIILKAGELLPFTTAISPEAIQQKEIVVEAKQIFNTDKALLAARKKATALGDAVSAEQVRKSPDKDAAEVLRRVTGLSVSDGKYVFVRGLGERYSSTEVDGVRLVSPEQNKRVVPLDLVPANLLDNIVVQKTYTADRPGEFGGGDVQVRTKDFPGKSTWSFSVTQGYSEGATFQDRKTYASTRADIFGYGAGSRGLPSGIADVSQLPNGYVFTNRPFLAQLGRSFTNIWSPYEVRAIPNGGYSATYGNEVKLLGMPLGMIQSWSLGRSFDSQDENQKFYMGSNEGQPRYDYQVQRWTESVQLGGLSAWSLRFSPRHSLHLRGIYTNSADDEVMQYEGFDYSQETHLRSTRLMYVQRDVLSGTLEGKHDLRQLLGLGVDWKLNRSQARRQQPDRREFSQIRADYGDGVYHWIGGRGSREYGDQKDDGWGGTLTGSLPYRLGKLGNGKVAVGYDKQVKDRDYSYRRFYMWPSSTVNPELPAESLYAPGGYDGSRYGGYVEEYTFNDPITKQLDNSRAKQRVTARFVSFDVPLGKRAKMNMGVRVEKGFQNIQSFALSDPDNILTEGKIDKTDALPSGNLTWGLTDAVNLRLAASRTISRPDITEMSPTPFFEYSGGMLVKGNPNLDRAQLDNYDARLEAFPNLGEVVAAGFFYKKLHHPIENAIFAGSSQLILTPQNSDHGRNLGIELEARTGLGRFTKALKRFSVNTNASFIHSDVEVPVTTQLGSETHPLQGQADYLVNAALSYTSSAGADVSVLFNSTGKRLRALGVSPLPDIYLEPTHSLDVTTNFTLLRSWRLKVSAKNLTDPRIRQLQGEREAVGFRTGRVYSVAFSYGS